MFVAFYKVWVMDVLSPSLSITMYVYIIHMIIGSFLTGGHCWYLLSFLKIYIDYD